MKKALFVFLMVLMMVVIVANATAENYDHFLDIVGIESIRSEYSNAIQYGVFLEDNVVLYNDTIYVVSENVELDATMIPLEDPYEFTLGELQAALETLYWEHGYPGVKVSAKFADTFDNGWPLIVVIINNSEENMNDMEGGYLTDNLSYHRLVVVTKVKVY